MNRAMYRIFQFGAAGIVFVTCLLIRDVAPDRSSASLVSSANAIIGRPLTPVSYAGVAPDLRTGRGCLRTYLSSVSVSANRGAAGA
jgi:hypothetical protein